MFDHPNRDVKPKSSWFNFDHNYISEKPIKVPGVPGRWLYIPERENAEITARQIFATRLYADHYDGDNKLRHQYDLGSGLVTNVGVTAMANDFAWTEVTGVVMATLALSNQHMSGTGATAAAATDIKLQTISTYGGQTAVAGTQTLVSAANAQAIKTVATLNYSGGEAVTEWGLHTSATASATTGSPFTSGTATTGTTTGTSLTASSSTVRGFQQYIFEDTTAGTPFYGLVLSNTTSIVTVPAWYTAAAGTTSGVNPVNADAYTIYPVMWDHKVFSAINVVNGDSIQFTYTLTINSGG